MRRPIQFQLLLPTLLIVVSAIALTSGAGAYFMGRYASQNERESLRRVVAALTEAPYPPVESVLWQMRGLSGNEFVLFDQQGDIQAGTLALSDSEKMQLQSIARRPASGEPVGGPTVMLGGCAYLSQHVSVAPRPPSVRTGSLIVLYPKERWSVVVHRAVYPAVIAGAIAIVAVALVTAVLAHRFVQPIHRLRHQAAAIARGDFQPVEVARRDDEIRDLAVSINRMSEQLGQYENQVRRHEQLRILGQLGAGMAHQLRNAAAGGRMAIELHRRECSRGNASESLDVALRQLGLMETYLQRLLVFGQDPPVARESVALPALVADALALVRPACVHAGVELAFEPPAEPLAVCGDAPSLRQLIVNLVLNALDAARGQPQPGRIGLELRRIEADRVVLEVCDTGPGPTPELAGRLFEPFVTSKPEGTGLGLYVARRVAETHRGTLHWRRVEGQTYFSVVLPLQNAS